jgi:hypothetical protein
MIAAIDKLLAFKPASSRPILRQWMRILGPT